MVGGQRLSGSSSYSSSCSNVGTTDDEYEYDDEHDYHPSWSASSQCPAA